MTAPAYVWVIESGDYEQRGVNGVAASVAAAVAWLKGEYRPPYIVAWDEPEEEPLWPADPDWCQWSIKGRFEHVQHYSVAHDCTYDITRYRLLDAQP